MPNKRGSLIGLCGIKGSGKDTCADILIHRASYMRVCFADHIRNICEVAYGLTHHEMRDRALKEATIRRYPFRSPRWLVQTTGSMLRFQFPGFVVTHWLNKAEKLLDLGLNVVVPDVRFSDEAATVRRLGGKLIRIVRPGLERTDFDESEMQVDSFSLDATFMNYLPLRESQEGFLRVAKDLASSDNGSIVEQNHPSVPQELKNDEVPAGQRDAGNPAVVGGNYGGPVGLSDSGALSA